LRSIVRNPRRFTKPRRIFDEIFLAEKWGGARPPVMADEDGASLSAAHHPITRSRLCEADNFSVFAGLYRVSRK
jgi:hypothetical protein